MANIISSSTIATILNESYAQNCKLDDGADATLVTLQEDLGNIVDFGKQVSELSGSALASTITTMLNKIRTTHVIPRLFESTAPDVYMDTEEFIGMTEIAYVGENDFSASLEFDCVANKTGGSNSFEDLFGKAIPAVNAVYFDKFVPYRQKITITADQFMDAFLKPEAMTSLFAEQVNVLEVKMKAAVDLLRWKAFDSAVLEVSAKRSADITTELGTNYTASDLVNAIKAIVRNFKEYNNQYADEKFVSSIPASEIRLAIRADVYDKLVTSYANVFNPEFLKLPVDSIKDLNHFGKKADPDCITGITPSVGTGKYGKVDKLVAVIYAKEGIGCSMQKEKITSQYVANEDITNYFHLATAGYRVVTDLPMALIVENGGGYTEVALPAKS